MAKIIGTDADEVLEQGTEGDDTFFPGGGYDEIYTFGGHDLIVIEPGNDVDHIEDFDPAHDEIVFNGFPDLHGIQDLPPFISVNDEGTPSISLPGDGVEVLFNAPVKASDLNAATVSFNRNLEPNYLHPPPEHGFDIDPNTPVTLVEPILPRPEWMFELTT
jgi:hypothetical protein